jgi:hypothetical protein
MEVIVRHQDRGALRLDHLPHRGYERMGWRLSAGRLKGLTLIAPADLPPSYEGSGD